MLANVVEPKSGGIALEPVKCAAVQNRSRPDLCDGDGQQQVDTALAHVAGQLPFFAHVARQQIELRPVSDPDILRILRWRCFAKVDARGVAAALCNVEDEARRIKAIFRELSRTVFARGKHASRSGDRQQPTAVSMWPATAGPVAAPLKSQLSPGLRMKTAGCSPAENSTRATRSAGRDRMPPASRWVRGASTGQRPVNAIAPMSAVIAHAAATPRLPAITRFIAGATRLSRRTP